MLASIQIAEHKARAAATFRRPTKVFEDGIQLMQLNYLLAFDGVIASRGGIPLIEQGDIIGAIGCSGGTDSQDDSFNRCSELAGPRTLRTLRVLKAQHAKRPFMK